MDPVQTVECAAGFRHGMVAVAINLLVLAELCIAMAFASSAADDFTATFLKWFFGMLVPTLALGIFARRRLAARSPAP